MRRVGVVFAVAVIVGVAWAARVAQSDTESQKPTDDLKQLCDKIVDRISQGDTKGFSLYWQNMSCPPPAGVDRELDAARQLRELSALQKQWGKYLGCELIQEKDAGQSLGRYVFLGKYERGVTVWTFLVYRSQDDWKILSMYGSLQTNAVNSLFDSNS